MSIAAALNKALRRVPPWTIYIAGALYVVWVFWLAVRGELSVNPVRELEHRVGLRALQLLLLGLAVTPLRLWTGVNLMRFRRAIGLTAFGLIVVHLLVWVVLDIQLDWRRIWADILKRPYITLGMAGFAMLIPLALTSNNLSIRRLGGVAWRRLHRLVYPAVLAAGAHYLLVVKAWPPQPIVYFLVALGLLALRLVHAPKRKPARAAGQEG